MSKEEKAREYLRSIGADIGIAIGLEPTGMDREIYHCIELEKLLSDFANSQKPNILDIAEEQPKDIQNLIESVDLLVSQLEDSIGDEFDTYNLDMVKDSLNSLIK